MSNSSFAFATRVAKTRVNRMKQLYPCIPEWQTPRKADPFDYPLRTKQEVMDQHKFFPPNFRINMIYKRYTATDKREHKDHMTQNMDDRERVAKITFDLRELGLQPLQRERFVFLMGPRYNPARPHFMKVVCKQYATYAENFLRANDILREIYWESLRAPMTATNFVRNPYLRERMIKKIFGKTKAERTVTARRMKRL